MVSLSPRCEGIEWIATQDFHPEGILNRPNVFHETLQSRAVYLPVRAGYSSNQSEILRTELGRLPIIAAVVVHVRHRKGLPRGRRAITNVGERPSILGVHEAHRLVVELGDAHDREFVHML